MKIIVISLAVAVLAACASGDASRKPGTLSERTLRIDGLVREYLLYRPGKIRNEQPMPLVIVFHGGGGTAAQIERSIGKPLHRMADRDRFVVAYPNAKNKLWDFGAGKVSEALDERVDDKKFFRTLIDELSRTLPVDDRRVFATGISRGGQAAYFVACSYPDRIRAIAAIAMPMPEFIWQRCETAANIGVAVLNGTDDPIVPYNGGDIRIGKQRRGKVLSTDNTISFWRERNACNETASSVREINPAKDGIVVVRTTWSDCDEAPVVLYRIDGGGHTWPSGRGGLPKFMVGATTKDINGAEEVWAFFQRFE